MRRSVRSTALRTVRRAVTWRPKQAGATDVDIAWLVSPLRYDVVVRAQFFGTMSHRPSGQSDAEFVEAAHADPYFVWFREIEARRFRPWLLKDEGALRADFAERVTGALVTHRSFSERGYDLRFPVTLRSVRRPRPSDSGLLVDRVLHVGDGGHRLALLLNAGKPLLPAMYRVDPRPRPVIDNTEVLLRHLAVSEEDYARFVSRGYLDHEVSSIEEIEDQLATAGSPRLQEFRQVVTAHRRAKAQR